MALDDTNGDGNRELAVVQGTNVHILESRDSVVDACDLQDLVKEQGLPKGIENSLVSKADNACKKYEDGKLETAGNILEAFINEVEAQSGKKIPEATADTLIAYANNAIAQI